MAKLGYVDGVHPAGRKAVFVGDLVDRGPRIVHVLRTVMAMGLALVATLLAYRLGVLLICEDAWQLLTECVTSPRAELFVAPSARLGRVPWSLLAKPASFPTADDVLAGRTEAVTAELTEGYRLMELVDVLMAVPTNIAASRRATAPTAGGDPLLILDPRVPGQRPDSTLGSVLGSGRRLVA